jgi:RNA polymerase sigma factor (sigma-70 family)
MQPPIDDADLVLAARLGEKTAFATLVDRHRVMLVALCRRTLGDASLAEDAAQEAVLQAMLNLDRLRESRRFGAWLAGIGLNVCRRWLHEARSHGHWSWEALYGGRYAPEPTDWRPGPEELAEASDLAERVRRAAADLPPGQRASVLLFYLSGLTHAETAAQLGIDVGAVKTRLHKARLTLRRKLAAIWEEQMATQVQPQGVEMRVIDVRRVPAEGGVPRKHIVVLEEVGGGRRLPIWVGEHEGGALAMHLEDVAVPRPQTYAFVASLLRATGARVHEARIVRLTDGVFYAVVVVHGPRGTSTVDARPSDAINLALVAGAPIYVESAVLAALGAQPGSPPSPTDDPFGPGTEGVAEVAAEIKAISVHLPPTPPAQA